MRIAHVITRLILGGAQENTVLCCEDLLREYGDEVLLITGPPLGPEGSLLERARAGVAPGGRLSADGDAAASEADADAAWAAFRQHHAMTRNYRSDVRKVDLGAKGTWYRLRLVPFADKTAALAFCTRLKADGGACFLAK